jgi:hypothetical protein
LTYQWYFEGTEVEAATESSYVIESVASGDEGNYYVVVSNDIWTVQSITVPLVSFQIPNNGLIARYDSDALVTITDGHVSAWGSKTGNYGVYRNTPDYRPYVNTEESQNGYNPIRFVGDALNTGYQEWHFDDNYSWSYSVLLRNYTGTQNRGAAIFIQRNEGSVVSGSLRLCPAYDGTYWSLLDQHSVGTLSYTNSAVPSTTGDLQLLTVIVTSGVAKLYLGTHLVATHGGSWNFSYISTNINSAYFSIGASGEWYERIADVRIYQVNLWNRALTTGAGSDLSELVDYINEKYNTSFT